MAQETTLGLPKENKNRQPNKDKGRGIRKKKFLKFPKNSIDQEPSIGNSEINQIFETAADGMRVIDKDFNVIRVNTTFCRHLRMKEDRLPLSFQMDLFPSNPSRKVEPTSRPHGHAGSVARTAFEACPAVKKTQVSLRAPHKHYSLKGE